MKFWWTSLRKLHRNWPFWGREIWVGSLDIIVSSLFSSSYPRLCAYGRSLKEFALFELGIEAQLTQLTHEKYIVSNYRFIYIYKSKHVPLVKSCEATRKDVGLLDQSIYNPYIGHLLGERLGKRSSAFVLIVRGSSDSKSQVNVWPLNSTFSSNRLFRYALFITLSICFDVVIQNRQR